MKIFSHILTTFFLALAFTCSGPFICPTPAAAGQPAHLEKNNTSAKERKAVFAGLFYPSSPQKLQQTISGLISRITPSTPSLPKGARLRALIMPHAGYAYSGWTAAHVAKPLKESADSDFSRVILLAPDHRIGFSGVAITPYDYATPLGRIRLSPLTYELAEGPFFSYDDSFKIFNGSGTEMPGQQEHSLEVLLPFLQTCLKDFELVPIIVGHTAPEKIASAVIPYLDPRTLLVISSDLSHFLKYKEASIKDRETIAQILALDSNILKDRFDRACGMLPILTLINIAKEKGWLPMLLQYANSGDTGGDKNRVVGYAAIAFYEPEKRQEKITADAGRELVHIARRSLEGIFTAHKGQLPQYHSELEKKLREPGASFVTLTIQGRLRGCIGSLQAERSLIDDIRENAKNAALHDPRFPPLEKDELDMVKVEVSVLSEPVELEYKNNSDITNLLRPDMDGVILQKGWARATFLPQVWEQLPDPVEFMGHLSRKAGLSSNGWREGPVKIYTYQVHAFAEED